LAFSLIASIAPILLDRHWERRNDSIALLERDPRYDLVSSFRERRQHDNWRCVFTIEIVALQPCENPHDSSFNIRNRNI
jgi:hypothetical protein